MNHTIGVCGFGRCGSTMVMAMLWAGGCPCPGEAPWEDPFPHKAQPGTALKLLDLYKVRGLPAAAEWKFIWLDRDPMEQARSQIKFAMATMPGAIKDPEDAIHRFACSYGQDRPRDLAFLRRHGEVMVLQYERILAAPLKFAKALRRFYPELDLRKAAAIVHERDGVCRPDLAVELAVVQGRLYR